MIPPGEELDALVLQRMRRRKVVGQALCVPVGPSGLTLGWQVVAPVTGPMHSAAEVRKVFIGVCVCSRDLYEDRVHSEAKGERIAGHRIDCLKVVPRYSLDNVAALQIWHRFDEVEIQRKRGKKEIVTVTVYDEPGAYVEGTSFAHALSLAVVAMKEVADKT